MNAKADGKDWNSISWRKDKNNMRKQAIVLNKQNAKPGHCTNVWTLWMIISIDKGKILIECNVRL